MATRVWFDGLGAHAVDDPADLRIELVRIEAARRLGDVHHEVGAALELVATRITVTRKRRSVATGDCVREDQEERAVLDRVRELVDPVVGLDDLLGRGEVAVEQRLGAGGDRLGGERGESDDVAADLVELVFEWAPCELGVSSIATSGVRFSSSCHPEFTWGRPTGNGWVNEQ